MRLAFALTCLLATVSAAQVTCHPDGTATVCDLAGCARVGPCSLGCTTTSGCFGPSNVTPGFESDAGSLLLQAGEVFTLSSDDGALLRSDGGVVRPAGGFDAVTRTVFSSEAQRDAGQDVGVFSVEDLVVERGATLLVQGSRPIVIKAASSVYVEGTIDVGALGQLGGPGGFNGGDGGAPGMGPGGGALGQFATAQCTHLCAVGSTGGAFGASGGAGGSVTIGSGALADGGGLQLMGPLVSVAYGTPDLRPLRGGSGGAGGVVVPGFTSANPGLNPRPGLGGGGGGALQLVARFGIVIADGGVITAPGEAGGSCISAGGAAGGSGGAILLESPNVVLAPASVVAANGGGGAASDCT